MKECQTAAAPAGTQRNGVERKREGCKGPNTYRLTHSV